MGDFPDGVFHILLLPDGHPISDQKGKGALAEILQQDFLSLDGFKILGQVI